MKNNNTLPIILGIVAVGVIGAGIYMATQKPAYAPTEGSPAANPAETANYVYPKTYPTTYSTTVTQYTTTTAQSSTPIVATRGVSYISSASAVLNGEVNPNGVQTSYWYEYGTGSSLGSVTRAQLIGGGYLNYSAPFAIVNLKANTTYYYRISAQNQYGKVSGQTLSFKTTNTQAVEYVNPTAETRAATDISETSATLNGSTNPHGLSTFYWFEYGATPSLGNTTSLGSAGWGTTSVSLTGRLSNLKADNTYYFRLNTQNGYGTTTGSIRSFTTLAVNPPPKVAIPSADTNAATNIDTNSVRLNGEVNPNGVQTTYYFEYGKQTLPGLFNLNKKTDSKSVGAGSTATSVFQDISNLDKDSTYYFRLVANNKNGTDRGSILSFTTDAH